MLEQNLSNVAVDEGFLKLMEHNMETIINF